MPAGTPEECAVLFAKYLNAGDVEAVVGLYEAGAAFARGDGTVATGTQAIRKAIETLAGTRPNLTVRVARVIEGGDDLAVLYDDWSLTAEGADGSTLQNTGRAIEVVRRQQDGTWRFIVDDPRGRS
jgi:uncharacterized protein (TIGR02246 family)